MPGKVNPVIPEAINQMAFAIMGNDLTVALATEAVMIEEGFSLEECEKLLDPSAMI